METRTINHEITLSAVPQEVFDALMNVTQISEKTAMSRKAS